MSRASNGAYTLPTGNPVVTGTVISSNWANTTLSDLATEMTDSLDRSGKGGMLAPFGSVDGAVALPGMTFNSEPSSGLYRISAGLVGMSVLSRNTMSWASTGAVVIPATAAAANAALTVGGTAASAFTPVFGVVGGANTFMSVKDTATVVELLLGTSGASGFLGTATNHPFALRTNNVNIFNVTAAGVITQWEGTVNIAAAGLMGSASYETGSFTATGVGFTAGVTGTANWVRVGPVVTIAWPTLSGTSNTTTFSITGLPAALAPARNVRVAAIIEDNTAFESGAYQLLAAGTTVTVIRGNNTGTFTNAGTKAATVVSMTYSLI